jgi:hypothetical protein
MWGLGVGTVVTGTSGRQLEALDGEGQVLIISIIDQEPVVDGLLQALGLVALWHQGTGGAGGGALLHTGGLGQGLVVSLDVVDDDSPLAMNIDGPQGLDVSGLGGAQVGLLHDLLQPVNGVVGVGQHILVHLLHGVVVVLDGLLDLVGGVLGVLKTEGLGVVLGTDWGSIVGLLMMRGGVVGRSVVRSGSIGSGSIGSRSIWSGSIWSRVVWLLVVWLRVIRSGVIRSGSGAICWGWGVAVGGRGGCVPVGGGMGGGMGWMRMWCGGRHDRNQGGNDL